jgi:hypothetical protein
MKFAIAALFVLLGTTLWITHFRLARRGNPGGAPILMAALAGPLSIWPALALTCDEFNFPEWIPPAGVILAVISSFVLFSMSTSKAQERELKTLNQNKK